MNRDSERSGSKAPHLTRKQWTLLEEVFSALTQEPAGVDALRFRARHDDALADIQAVMEARLIIRREDRFIMPLVGIATLAEGSNSAAGLLKLCAQVFKTLRLHFKQHQIAKITVPELAAAAELSEPDVRRGLMHLLDLTIWAGRTSDLSRPDAYLMVGEGILDYQAFDDVIAEQRRFAERAAAKLEGSITRGTPRSAYESAFETYEPRAVLGEGGAGRVYLAVRSDGTEVALKVLRPDLSSKDKRKRFKNEIDFLSRNRHENIIRVLDSGLATSEHGSAPFYVMPRMAGTLRDLLRRRIPHEQVLPLYSQVLNGVEAAHLLKVTHRDLKPENILYDPATDRLLIADFGIAHFEEEELLTAVESKQNDRLANFLYAAPEQRTRGAQVDHRADIYALGLLMNEMFTGSVIQGAGYETIVNTAAMFAYLDPLVERMIQSNPANRPASIEEVKRELLKRQNEFVTLQTLDQKRREVVPTYRADEVAPVALVNVDWDGQVLTFDLSRAPEPGWIARFRQPREGHSSVMGKGPEAFHITGSKAYIHASEHQVDSIVGHMQQYLQMATRGYQQDLQIEANKKQESERERLKHEQEIAEARARVLGRLKF